MLITFLARKVTEQKEQCKGQMKDAPLKIKKTKMKEAELRKFQREFSRRTLRMKRETKMDQIFRRILSNFKNYFVEGGFGSYYNLRSFFGVSC